MKIDLVLNEIFICYFIKNKIIRYIIKELIILILINNISNSIRIL